MNFLAMLRARRRITAPASDAARIQLSTTAINRSWTEGAANPSSDSLGITNIGQGAFAGVQVSDDAGWLTTSGTNPATLSYDMTGKTTADHPLVGVVTVSDAKADNSPQTCTVTFSIQAPGGSPGVIDAEIRTFNTTGAGLVSAGFPLRPGDLTDADFTAKKIAVWVGGSEKPIYAEAIRGRFPDGSIRSVLLQFQHTIPDSNPIQAEVRLGTARGTSDLTKSTINDTVLLSGRVILPTDPAHLVATWVTFQPLLEASQENAANKAFFNDLFDQRFEALKNTEMNVGGYQSTYESGRALLARWCATGNSKYYWNAMQRQYYLMVNYSLPPSSYPITPAPNETPLTLGPGNNGDGSQPPEQHSLRYISFASAYLLSGCIEYWNMLGFVREWATWGRDTQALAIQHWVDALYNGRFNLRQAPSFALAVCIDSTKVWNVGATGRQCNYPQELPWVLDAWETHKYAEGNYRDGMRGTRHTTNVAGGPGWIPNFQIKVLTDFPMLYYLNTHADSRLPGWIQRNVDIVWDNNVEPLQQGDEGWTQGGAHGDVGYRYMNTPTAQEVQGNRGCWTVPMWSDALAFCKAFYGTPKYTTNYAHAINPANLTNDLTWHWKIFGEIYGNQMSAPYYDQVGIPSGLPSSIRTPTQY